jgi:hypothetical protein
MFVVIRLLTMPTVMIIMPNDSGTSLHKRASNKPFSTNALPNAPS